MLNIGLDMNEWVFNANGGRNTGCHYLIIKVNWMLVYKIINGCSPMFYENYLKYNTKSLTMIDDAVNGPF